MTDVRKIIDRELKRQKKTRYWLAKQSGLRMGTVYTYLNGKNDVTGTTLGKMFDALKLKVVSK